MPVPKFDPTATIYPGMSVPTRDFDPMLDVEPDTFVEPLQYVKDGDLDQTQGASSGAESQVYGRGRRKR